MSDKQYRKPSSDPTIVSPDDLKAALERVMNGETEGTEIGLSSAEPWLNSFVRDELLRTAGRLTMCGIDPCVARGVANDVQRTLAVALLALRFGYASLLEGLIEEPPAAGADGTSANDEESGPPAEREND